MAKINFLKVRGSHFDCGSQMGRYFRDMTAAAIDYARSDAPEGKSWEETVGLSRSYFEITQKKYPYIIEELAGVASGAGVDLMELFASLVEELWSDLEPIGKCTDIVVCPPATSGEIIAGHNNDLPDFYLDKVTVVEYDFPGEGKMLSIGVCGFGLSIGVNSFGVGLTGNELAPNDEKVGVPRSLIARAILSAKNYDEALKIALDPDRASSYDNIIVTSDPSKIVAVEGSATDHALIYPTDGVLVHSNHYVMEKMLPFENELDSKGSIERQARIMELGRGALRPVSEEGIKKILRDHGKENVPSDGTICRHEDGISTVFSSIINFGSGVVSHFSGRPCEGEYEEVWRFGSH